MGISGLGGVETPVCGDCNRKPGFGACQGLAQKMIYRKNPHAHKNKIGTSTPPLPKNPRPPPPKGGNLWVWGFSSRKSTKMPGAHKIGAAIFGPRITGGKIMDAGLSSE